MDAIRSAVGARDRAGAAALPRPAELRATLARWLKLHRERRALRGLDARLLADIGLDPAEAAAEAARPFWEVPAWRR